jgi:hypothetical protein
MYAHAGHANIEHAFVMNVCVMHVHAVHAPALHCKYSFSNMPTVAVGSNRFNRWYANAIVKISVVATVGMLLKIKTVTCQLSPMIQ